MKENQQMGFTPVETHPLWRHTQSGDVTFTLGVRSRAWRAYGYRWHSDQDISREHKIAELCARGGTAEDATKRFRALCRESGWPMPAVLEATQEMLDQLDSGYAYVRRSKLAAPNRIG